MPAIACTPLQLEIDPEEILLRSMRKQDLNRADNSIKIAALKPGRTERQCLSLIREEIGTEESRLAARTFVHREAFWGFGKCIAAKLSAHSISIEDDRATFMGHANMTLGYDIPPGPPNTPPEMTEAYAEARARLIALAGAFEVVQDVDVAS